MVCVETFHAFRLASSNMRDRCRQEVLFLKEAGHISFTFGPWGRFVYVKQILQFRFIVLVRYRTGTCHNGKSERLTTQKCHRGKTGQHHRPSDAERTRAISKMCIFETNHSHVLFCVLR